jgi:hypothetical protein
VTDATRRAGDHDVTRRHHGLGVGAKRRAAPRAPVIR